MQPQPQQQNYNQYQPIPQYNQPPPPQYQPQLPQYQQQLPQYQPQPQYNQPQQPQYQPQQPQYQQPLPQYQPQQPQYGMENINRQGTVGEMNYPTQEELLQHQQNEHLYPGAPTQLPPNCNPNNVQQPSYPYQDPTIMQGTNIQSNPQNQQNGSKYFGFFGPELKKNY